MIHILIIDDNPTDRLLVKRELEREFSPLKITEISDSQSFESALEKGGFNLAITDYQLRWNDGLEVFRVIKFRYPQCPIVMFTNTGNEEIAVEAMKSGLDDYIIKSPRNYLRLCVAAKVVLDRAAAQQQVTRLEKRLNLLLERLNVGVFISTCQGVLVESNQAFLRLFEASNLAEVQDIYLQQLFLHPLDVPAPAAQNRELTFTLPDGRVKWISLTQYVNHTAGESAIEGLVEDITELKQAELALHQLNENLEERVKERTAKLSELNAELESFTYSVSHDLRAPLRAINFYVQMFLKDCAGSLDAAGENYLNRISNSTVFMNTLIENLLEYSRLGRSELSVRPIDLNSFVSRSIAQLQVEIAQKQAQIDVVSPLPLVLGHPATVLQVLTNLLSNAIKFVAPETQPQVRVWAESDAESDGESDGESDAESDGQYIYLWIEDNGIGIAPENRERIFGLFDRLHGQEAYPGTGIGLAIARKGIERTGGAIGLESSLGKGTRFWVKLPKYS
ncbi:MAG: response regulator [Oscillatoriales cyanobacterium RU_3_3]|nr:response regulator [Oscillatoriales cyanobacterium RU_3_3]